jgi:chromosome segregation ATPase
MIADFITGTPAERQEKAKAQFIALYDALNTQRHQVMDALERFSRKQRALAEDIRTSIAKMRDLQDTPGSNQAEIDDLGKRLQWETRIFSDRQKSTSYVCEVPVILEKRLFDLAHAIQAAAGT